MNGNAVEIDTIQRLVADIDYFINEMLQVRRRITSLHSDNKTVVDQQSVRNAEWFGMWVDHEGMQGLSSHEWLDRIRAQQWAR